MLFETKSVRNEISVIIIPSVGSFWPGSGRILEKKLSIQLLRLVLRYIVAVGFSVNFAVMTSTDFNYEL